MYLVYVSKSSLRPLHTDDWFTITRNSPYYLYVYFQIDSPSMETYTTELIIKNLCLVWGRSKNLETRNFRLPLSLRPDSVMYGWYETYTRGFKDVTLEERVTLTQLFILEIR